MRTITELSSLSGKTAVVTGACGYLGKTFIQVLLELGADVIGIDKNLMEPPQNLDSLCRTHGGSLKYEAADFSDENAVIGCVRGIIAVSDRLDILINNAAFAGDAASKGWSAPFEQQDVGVWRNALEINLTAVFLLTQQFAPLLRQSGSGSIINIGSIYGACGPDLSLYTGTQMNNPAAYAASKGGLIQFTRWLATVLAPEIRVNAISPGGIYRQQPEVFVDRYAQKTPLKRMATEEDMKGAVAFLASDLSNYVTGQNIFVDGGWSVH